MAPTSSTSVSPGSAGSVYGVLYYTDPALGPDEAHGEYVGYAEEPDGAEKCGRSRRPERILRDARLPCLTLVADGRSDKSISLATCGFELRRFDAADGHSTTVSSGKSPSATWDFSDDADVIARYVPQVEKLVHAAVSDALTTAEWRVREVAVWDLARRTGTRHNEFQESAPQTEKSDPSAQAPLDILAPVPLVHADFFGDAAARERLRQLLERPVDTLNPVEFGLKLTTEELVQTYVSGKEPFLSLNVWRSTDTAHPVETDPLALCKPRSVEEGSRIAFEINCPDVVVTETHFAHPGQPAFAQEKSESPSKTEYFPSAGGKESAAAFWQAQDAYASRHAVEGQSHEWVFFPQMTSDEVLIFTSAGGGTGIEAVPHTSFKPFSAEDNGPPEAGTRRPRQSIEARVFVFLEDAGG